MRRPATKARSHEGTKGRRRIAVVTGTRADYGVLRSTIQAIADHPRLRLQLVATGTHLLKKFGHTVADIVSDGWKIDARVPMQRGDDRPRDQAEGLARGVSGIARFLDHAKTDIVLVLGDRIEAMAGALAGVTTGRIVAHIHGGDVALGDFDDSLRHAITKLAHLHFTATESARRRVIQMGEQPDRVYCVGAPGLDRLADLRRSKIEDRRADDETRLALVVQHPCGRRAETERRVMAMILAEVERAGLDAVCVYPNSDRGHRGIIQAIETHARRADKDRFRVARSLVHDDYLRLLIQANVLIGNSSSGIIEAAAAGTPAVDVGSRQEGREREGRCVFHADERPDSIRAALRRALSLGPIKGYTGPYGQGCAGERIAASLAEVALDDRLRRKLFADHVAVTASNRTLPQSPLRKAGALIQTMRPRREVLLPK